MSGTYCTPPGVVKHFEHSWPLLDAASYCFAMACRCDEEVSGTGRSRGRAARSADILPVVAEHRLPKGVTSLCPSAAPGQPITAGTRNGDIFQLTMTRQVWQPFTTHCPQARRTCTLPFIWNLRGTDSLKSTILAYRSKKHRITAIVITQTVNRCLACLQMQSFNAMIITQTQWNSAQAAPVELVMKL